MIDSVAEVLQDESQKPAPLADKSRDITQESTEDNQKLIENIAEFHKLKTLKHEQARLANPVEGSDILHPPKNEKALPADSSYTSVKIMEEMNSTSKNTFER